MAVGFDATAHNGVNGARSPIGSRLNVGANGRPEAQASFARPKGARSPIGSRLNAGGAYSTPLVLGTPPARSSRATAAFRARARPLKIASAIW